MTLLRLHETDDVAIALAAMHGGEQATVTGDTITVRSSVPAGHKMALRDLPAGTLVHKYGQVIGRITQDVRAGEHVHVHNLAMPEGAVTRPPAQSAQGSSSGVSLDGLRRTFAGIRRSDGRVATRNYVGILTTVNCSATVARKVAQLTENDKVEGVDGVVALTHGTGCGMADSGPGWDLLRRTLRGYADHPNIGGLVVLGLGCEVNAVAGLMEDLELPADVPVTSYSIQEAGGTAAAVAEGVRLVRGMMSDLGGTSRTEVGVEELVLGLQCGGSDGWSGLTANPALGVASDLLVAAGATSILGETPEIFGAEHLLAARAVSGEVADDLLARVQWWNDYTAANGTTMDGNPSPGNKEGGITTILEKSLGAVAKAGGSPLTQVVGYAEEVPRRRGLVFMDTPGYDPVSVTGMVAGGANLICFTTGRGSVFGSRPVPTVKLSSNVTTARWMAGDVDLDCSLIVEDGVSLADMGRRVYDLLLDVASGRQSVSEELGMGGEEIVPWQLGAVL
jgi:altronate hydrolase